MIDVLEQNVEEAGHGLLEMLLKDKTTGKNLRWATDHYRRHGKAYSAESEIFPALIVGRHSKIITPRVLKDAGSQSRRTKDKAEVFTASWICNEQNNLIDEAWFGKTNVFNVPKEGGWTTNKKPIDFPNNRTWQAYVDAKRLEVSCGEAPYLVSRYDAVSGKQIGIEDRIGLLDRKLRIVNENVEDEAEWLKWTERAFQSIYGFDYQGDNVLLARENLLQTFIDNMECKFKHQPSIGQLQKIANILAWNIWQMDGITMTAPYSEAKPEYVQLSLFQTEGEEARDTIPCRIYDWRAKCSLEYRSMVKGR